MWKSIVFTCLCLIIIQAEIVPFNNDAIEKIFQQKKPALFLFTQGDEASISAQEAFKALDEKSPEGVILTLSDKDDGFGLFDRLSEYLGVDTSTGPKVLFLGAKAEKFKFDQETISLQTLSNFITRVQGGQVEQFLKSAPIPQGNDEPVKVVVGKTFNQIVLQTDKQVLVEFYAPWCGHCKQLAPHYDEAARKLSVNPNILLVKVDSTQNEVANVDIQGFPTLKFWGKDKSVAPVEYDGQRTVEGIIGWIKDHTQYEWVELDTAQEPTQQPAQEAQQESGQAPQEESEKQAQAQAGEL